MYAILAEESAQGIPSMAQSVKVSARIIVTTRSYEDEEDKDKGIFVSEVHG